MRINRDNNSSRAGMTAVEMAMILPLFFLLLMGMFDVGRWCWAHNVVQDAASRGARAAMLHEYTNADLLNLISGEVQGGGLNSSPDIVIGDRTPEEPVSVTVSVPFEFHILSSVLENLPQLQMVSATAVVRHER